MAKLVPVNYVSTAKQALFDIIVGRKIPEGESSNSGLGQLAAMSPYLVKGDYETIYKMMVNREMVLGASINCYDDGHQIVSQFRQLDVDFYPGETVKSKRVINIILDGNTHLFIDCNNVIYREESDIPFDDSPGEESDPGSVK